MTFTFQIKGFDCMKKKIITLIIVAAILSLISGIVTWQWNNIGAVFYFINYSQEELDKMLEKNKEELSSALSGMEEGVPRELTEEETKALEEGNISQEEAVEISLGKTTLEEKIQKNQTTAQNPKPQINETPQKTDKTSDLVAQLYVLKSSFLGKLSSLEAQGNAEYKATPKEQRTAEWKAAMISKYTNQIAVMEAECDAKVEAVISQIKAEITKNGGDMSIINTIRSTYENEKQIKKAQYMNTYLK